MLESLLQSGENRFWMWFQNNEDRLFNFQNEQETIFNELTKRLERINKHLTFEISESLKNGRREFVISADGIRTAFQAVERLYDQKPVLKRWIIVKFRPRRESLCDVTYLNKTVKIDEVSFAFFNDKNPDKIGIMLFFKDYKEREKNLWQPIGYLILDEALGEYDVEKKVGGILFDSVESEYFKHAQPIRLMAEEFDKISNKK